MIHTLEADGIQLEYNTRKILSSIYIKCETGKITGLLGRNGQGKSCLMKVLYGSLAAEKSVRFNNISVIEPFKQPNLLLFLPQENFIPKSLSIKRVFKDFDLDFNLFQERFKEFSKRELSRINSFSGGEQRLIEVYVIVKSATQFVLLDEPFTHLNPLQIEKVKELFSEEKINKGLLITDHMYRHVMDISDSLYVLSNGQTYLTKDVSDIEKYGYAKF
jgi:ABC-type lipopolysaccharide export system ATPase subunit